EGDLYLIGNFWDEAQIGGTNLTSIGGQDILVAKLDGGGNWLWSTRAGGLNLDSGYGITLSSTDQLHVCGDFRGAAGFGQYTLISHGTADRDLFAAGMDLDGNWLWAKKAGGGCLIFDGDTAWSITSDHAGNSYVAGNFDLNAAFGDIGLTGFGESDAFVAKISPVQVDSDESLEPNAPAISRIQNIRPNPLRQGGTTRIKVIVSDEGQGILSVFNLRGQIIARHELSRGTHEIHLKTTGLPSGIYFCRLLTPSAVQVNKIVLMR
ncbi:MAG: T9SS type A sorting domain-containing protein, partial [Candidatus Syntrophosphaera sp.]